MSQAYSDPKMVLPRWEDHRADAPYQSEEWASSDRGWCFDEARANEEHNCIGNYLRYDTDHGPNGETVHACAYRMETNPLTGIYSTFRYGSGWFHTIDEAKAFITKAAQDGAE